MENKSVYYGLLYGGASIAIYLVLWLVNPRLIMDMGIGTALSFGLPIVFMYLSIKATRDQQEGLISFGEAIKSSFITYVIGSLMGIIFTYILYNMIDPSLLELQKEVAVETAEKMMSMLGQDNEEMLEEMREEMAEQSDQLGMGQLMMGWFISLLFPGLMLSLIMSAILKKNP